MPEPQTCPGCLGRFSSQTAHLSQTSNPLCRRIAKARRSIRLHPVCISKKRPSRPSSKSPSPTSDPTSPSLSIPISTIPTPVASPHLASPSPAVTDDSDTESSDSENDLLASEAILGWEPPAPTCDPDIESDPPSDMELDDPPSPTLPNDIRQRTWVTPKVVQFPGPHAGEPVGSALPSHNAYATSLGDSSPSNPYSPFASKIDWEVAQWAKLRGPSSTSFADLLKVDGVRPPGKIHLYRIDKPCQLHEALGLSYKTPGQLNRLIDSLPSKGKFKQDEVVIAGEAFDVFYRDILECIRELFGKPELASTMKFAPERHYADDDETLRIYSNLHTGRWWWSTQVRYPKQSTRTTY